MDTEPSEWSEAYDILFNPLPNIYHSLVLTYQQCIVWHFISKIKSKWKKENLHIKENPKASFDQFESCSFNSFFFFLSANHVSNVDVKMSHALSIVLQV